MCGGREPGPITASGTLERQMCSQPHGSGCWEPGALLWLSQLIKEGPTPYLFLPEYFHVRSLILSYFLPTTLTVTLPGVQRSENNVIYRWEQS